MDFITAEKLPTWLFKLGEGIIIICRNRLCLGMVISQRLQWKICLLMKQAWPEVKRCDQFFSGFCTRQKWLKTKGTNEMKNYQSSQKKRFVKWLNVTLLTWGGMILYYVTLPHLNDARKTTSKTRDSSNRYVIGFSQI